jgi:hypothetical protein
MELYKAEHFIVGTRSKKYFIKDYDHTSDDINLDAFSLPSTSLFSEKNARKLKADLDLKQAEDKISFLCNGKMFPRAKLEVFKISEKIFLEEPKDEGEIE